MSESNGDDLKPREKEVTVLGQRYLLREASADAARQFRNSQLAAFRMRDGKLERFEGLADSEVLLVQQCLLGEDGEGKFKNPVHKQTILGWPARLVKPLFEWVQDASDLREGAKDPDPELIGSARKDLAQEHHPDRGGNADVFKGVNIALDWIKAKGKEREDERKNASFGGAVSFDQPKELAAP